AVWRASRASVSHVSSTSADLVLFFACSASAERRKTGCYNPGMINSRTMVESLSSSQLLSATRELVQKSRGTEADLVEHLGEIDGRKLYLGGPHPTMCSRFVSASTASRRMLPTSGSPSR